MHLGGEEGGGGRLEVGEVKEPEVRPPWPGTDTKNFTASRCPWNDSCA